MVGGGCIFVVIEGGWVFLGGGGIILGWGDLLGGGVVFVVFNLVLVVVSGLVELGKGDKIVEVFLMFLVVFWGFFGVKVGVLFYFEIFCCCEFGIKGGELIGVLVWLIWGGGGIVWVWLNEGWGVLYFCGWGLLGW